MNNCIFCQIVSGAIKAHVVYEDDEFLAFLDIRPLSAGHTLVIPKEHYRFVWDVENVGGYFNVVQKVARAIQKTFGTEEVFMKVVGEEVHHAHVWLFPNPEKANGDKTELEINVENLKKALV